MINYNPEMRFVKGVRNKNIKKIIQPSILGRKWCPICPYEGELDPIAVL